MLHLVCMRSRFPQLKMRFPMCYRFVMLLVVSLQLKAAACFFVKVFNISSYPKGLCLNDTGQIQSSGSWGNLSFLEFSYNSCLDPAAQFRFRDNGAMLNLKRRGCLAAFHNGSGYNLNMFYLYVDSVSLDTAACALKPNEGIYRAITQTANGALSVKGKNRASYDNWCVYWGHNSQLDKKYGIYHYMGLSASCYDRFIFGSVTCHGNMVKNANCPKDQHMVVKIASYHGLFGTKTFGLSDDYSCEIDVTCVVKKQCDGLHECNITVNDKLFSGDLCPGLSNYLYFEYQCGYTVKPYREPCGLVPDKPTNLTVSKITSRSAEISWLDPKDQGRYGTSRFWIKLKKENSQILSINTRKVNEYKISNLTSYTTYEIFVAAGNRYGFGEETTTSFRTSEEVSGQVSDTNEKDGGSEKYLAGIIILVILLVISLVVISYFVYQTRLKSQSTEAKQETTNEENKSSHIYDIPVTNNEQANNEQSTYAALKRPGPGEEGDGHVYAHLNQNVYEIQGETWM